MQRQVAHALLTRPPLSYLNASRRINSNSSVRLECVMHAASVHPEPGSNSRKNFISDTFRCLTSSRAIYLSFTFCLSSILNKLWRDQYLHLQCFVLLSCCSIFNDRAALLADSLTIIPQRFPFVNTFFQISWNFFQGSSHGHAPVSLPPSFVRACLLYYFFFPLSRGFRKFLEIFFKLFFQNILTNEKAYCIIYKSPIGAISSVG